jgi:hypothetical protein
MTYDDPTPLEEVLDMLLYEFGEPSPKAIATFSSRFPQYRVELMEFAGAWALDELLPPAQPISAEQEARVEARANSFLENALFARTRRVPPMAAASSLSALAEASGCRLHDVAQQVGMDLPLMSKLNGRRFKPERIPRRLAAKIAAIFQVDISAVLACWTGPPRVVHASFLATSTPIVPPQEDFAAAVAASSLSPAAKAALLEDD